MISVFLEQILGDLLQFDATETLVWLLKVLVQLCSEAICVPAKTEIQLEK